MNFGLVPDATLVLLGLLGTRLVLPPLGVLLLLAMYLFLITHGTVRLLTLDQTHISFQFCLAPTDFSLNGYLWILDPMD
jgi:hypothetical protein